MIVTLCWFFGVFTKVTIDGKDNKKYADIAKSAFFWFAIMLSLLVGMFVGLPFE